MAAVQPPHRRRIVAIALTLAAVVMAAATACGRDGATASAGVEGLGSGPSATDPTGVPTTKPPASPKPSSYPTTARVYSEWVLAAWKQKEIDWLGDLTTPGVQEQIIEIPGPPNQSWTYQRCDGAAGSSYCLFINNDGDVITLRISNALLGKAHAAVEVKLELTEYSSDVIDYVTAFVEAWRNANPKRMLALSSQAEVDFFTPYTPPDTYSVCAFKVVTVWQVRIHNTDGVDYIAKIADAARGKPHAISSHIHPVPLPPVCA